jgi:hypothetical protein
MTISRAQMASQLTGNKMKKTKKMNKGGDLLAMISPAASLIQSMKAGKPVGLANLSPLAHLIGRGKKEDDSSDKELKSDSKDRSTRPTLATRGMKRGGKVRGDGICQRGHTKGTMR